MNHVQPITERLANIEDWKRMTVYVERNGEKVAYVTRDFHDAWHDEMRARWQADVEAVAKT